jgi:uncharacterized membrane-anchored protein YhcB (DUF1043 family)
MVQSIEETRKHYSKELEEKINDNLELLENVLDSFVYVLKNFEEIANELPLEDQPRFKQVMKLMIDHLESGIKDAKFLLEPCKDYSKEYRV